MRQVRQKKQILIVRFVLDSVCGLDVFRFKNGMHFLGHPNVVLRSTSKYIGITFALIGTYHPYACSWEFHSFTHVFAQSIVFLLTFLHHSGNGERHIISA
jgi:hypothetical protein